MAGVYLWIDEDGESVKVRIEGADNTRIMILFFDKDGKQKDYISLQSWEYRKLRTILEQIRFQLDKLMRGELTNE